MRRSFGPCTARIGAIAEPEEIGSDGGNQSTLSGAVRWKRQADMLEHGSTISGGIRGYW